MQAARLLHIGSPSLRPRMEIRWWAAVILTESTFQPMQELHGNLGWLAIRGVLSGVLQMAAF